MSTHEANRMSEPAWCARDFELADGGCLRARMPAEAQPRRARIGDIAELPEGSAYGTIVEMTPRFCIIEEENGERHLQCWGEVTLGYIVPGHEAERGHPLSFVAHPVEGRIKDLYGDDERDVEMIINLALYSFFDMSRAEREGAAESYRRQYEQWLEKNVERDVLFEALDSDREGICAEARRRLRSGLDRDAAKREEQNGAGEREPAATS